jgi:hypothetical protein
MSDTEGEETDGEEGSDESGETAREDEIAVDVADGNGETSGAGGGQEEAGGSAESGAEVDSSEQTAEGKGEGEGGGGTVEGGVGLADDHVKKNGKPHMAIAQIVENAGSASRRMSVEHVSFHMAGDDGDTRSVKQRIADELCNSISVTMLVLFLLFFTIVLDSTNNGNPAWSTFVSLFFVAEISIRFYAKGLFRFIRDPFCVMDGLITLMDIVGVIMEIILSGGNEEAMKTIETLNLLRLLRVVRMARLCKLLCDVFMRKRSGLVEIRAKQVKEAQRKFKTGEYVLKDPEHDAAVLMMAEMSTVHRAYHLAKARHFNANKWVSRKQGVEFGKANAQPRRVKTFEGKYRKRLYGEEVDGELYNIRHTSVSEISEQFGLSIGLYFNTLYMCGVFFILLFLASSPAVAANAVAAGNSGKVVDPKLIGTAVCLVKENVMAFDAAGKNNTIDRLACEPTQAHITAAFLVLFMLLYFYKSYASYVERVIQEIDDKVISAQDFAVEVMDPDSDAFDPDEWYRFFKKYGKVVAITVTLDNGQLLAALSELFEIDHVLKQLPLDEEEKEGAESMKRPSAENSTIAMASLLESHADAQEKWEAYKLGWYQYIGFDRDRKWWLEKRASKDLEVQALLEAEYTVAKIFCVFDTEEDQLHCLNMLASGLIPAALDISDKARSEQFRGTNVLDIREAPEPEDVRYHCIGTCTPSQKTFQKIALLLVLIGTMAVETFFISYLLVIGAPVAVISSTLTVFNIAVPQFIKGCVEAFEVHEYHSTRTASLFYKMATFRIFNTAFVMYFLTPLDETLSPDFLLQVQTILISDALILPMKQLFDFGYQFKKQVVTRFMESTGSGYQKKMDLLFAGAPVEMNDR